MSIVTRLFSAIAVFLIFAGNSSWAADNGSMLAQAPAPAETSQSMSEALVKSLQEALNRQGIQVKIDGVMSEETRSGISKYQSQHHLPVTGEPDEATLAKLGVIRAQGS